MSLDPIVAEMLKEMAEANVPALSEMPPEDGRAMYRVMTESMPQADIAKVEDRKVPVTDGEVTVRIYQQQTTPDQPCLVYFHGGGWVIGDLETHDSVCRQLTQQAGCTVIAVDYRLAPEHPFPTPVNDCYEVTCWVHDQAAQLGINPACIAVGGDSAGGNLSACVSLKARDESGPQLVHQLLIYPVTDSSFDTESYIANKEGYMLSLEDMMWFWDLYLNGNMGDKNNPLVAPMKAADLSGLPPATVITAEYDPLRDEGEAYGEKLRQAGVATVTQRYDGMIHGFFGMTDLLEGSRQAMTFAVKQLKAAFQSA